MSVVPNCMPPLVTAVPLGVHAVADQLPPGASYRPLPTQPPATVRAEDEAAKPQVMQTVFDQRYDLSDHPIPGVMMSGGRKPIQGGVRVKPSVGVTWDELAQIVPVRIETTTRRRAWPPPASAVASRASSGCFPLDGRSGRPGACAARRKAARSAGDAPLDARRGADQRTDAPAPRGAAPRCRARDKPAH